MCKAATETAKCVQRACQWIYTTTGCYQCASGKPGKREVVEKLGKLQKLVMLGKMIKLKELAKLVRLNNLGWAHCRLASGVS